MSGRIAEALLGGASKKFPMLSPPKIKKESKSYTFVLKLAESNDRTYPEISWTELVRNAEQKEIDINAASGMSLFKIHIMCTLTLLSVGINTK